MIGRCPTCLALPRTVVMFRGEPEERDGCGCHLGAYYLEPRPKPVYVEPADVGPDMPLWPEGSPWGKRQ